MDRINPPPPIKCPKMHNFVEDTFWRDVHPENAPLHTLTLSTSNDFGRVREGQGRNYMLAYIAKQLI